MTTKEAIRQVLQGQTHDLKDIVLGIIQLVKAGKYKSDAVSITDLVNRNLREMVKSGEVIKEEGRYRLK